MPEPLSDILITDFFNQMKYHLPLSKRGSDTSIQNWINNALSRYNKIYVDNNKGIYDIVALLDFYNVDSSIINIKGLNTNSETRWCLIAPPDFYSARLTSCRLQAIIPIDFDLPNTIQYIQNIPIGVISSQDVNNTEPDANSGKVALVGGRQIMSVLTLDNTGTLFSSVIQIVAVYTYYRNVIYPDWEGGGSQFIDVLKKDVELIANYVVEEAYLPMKPPIGVIQAIVDREFQIIYGS